MGSEAEVARLLRLAETLKVIIVGEIQPELVTILRSKKSHRHILIIFSSYSNHILIDDNLRRGSKGDAKSEGGGQDEGERGEKA